MTFVLRRWLDLPSDGRKARPEHRITRTTTPTTVGDLIELIPDFLRSLRAANKSPRTVQTYGEVAHQLLSFLVEAGMPTDADALKREHVEAFMEHLLATRKPATASNRYRALALLFASLTEEGDVTKNPMVIMKPPRVPEDLVPVLPDADLRKLLVAADGRTSSLDAVSPPNPSPPYSAVRRSSVSFDRSATHPNVGSLPCPQEASWTRCPS